MTEIRGEVGGGHNPTDAARRYGRTARPGGVGPADVRIDVRDISHSIGAHLRGVRARLITFRWATSLIYIIHLYTHTQRAGPLRATVLTCFKTFMRGHESANRVYTVSLLAHMVGGICIL